MTPAFNLRILLTALFWIRKTLFKSLASVQKTIWVIFAKRPINPLVLSVDRPSAATLWTLHHHCQVRPHMEYACLIWMEPVLTWGWKGAELAVSSGLLESKLNSFYEIPFPVFLSTFNFLPLEARRKLLNMVFLQQLISGVVDFPELLELFDFRPAGRTRSLTKRLYTDWFIYVVDACSQA